MANKLEGITVAILVEDGFEQVELTGPRGALEQEGARTEIVSPKSSKVRAWNHTDWGEEFSVDRQLTKADPNDYHALLLPGGVMNPDRLRMNNNAITFIRQFFDQRKPVAAICHGLWTLIEADVVRGRTLTSWPSLKTDIRNAGGNWVDREVVVDMGLITSRKPADIPAFNDKMVEEFQEGRHVRTAG